MKHLHKISEADLLSVLEYSIPKGWSVFDYCIERWWQGIRIRKPYDTNDIPLNPDGFKYKTLFLEPELTVQYLKLTELGYLTDSN